MGKTTFEKYFKDKNMGLKKNFGPEYSQWLANLKEKIRNSQLKAALKINNEMLSLYWELGKAITEKQVQSIWGDKIITQLSTDLCSEFPDKKRGFSATNLKYVRKWYQFYTVVNTQSGVGQIGQQAVDLLQAADNELPMVLGLIPWGHHIQIFSKAASIEEALFYVQQTAAHDWRRSVLLYHLETNLFQRKAKSYNNFQVTLPRPQSDLANELIKNPYHLEFLGLGEEATERDLENEILANIKKFMLELGSGFSFLKQQYHLKVGERDYYVDLVFYHVRLHCYFIIELKVGEFKPEHAGKLEFYITAFDDLVKKPEDNPTIGLLLCKNIDRVTVEYTLRNKVKAMGVSEYRHSLPDDLKNELPDVEILMEELKKEIKTVPRQVDEKLNKLKGLIQKLNVGKVEFQKNDAIVNKVAKEVIEPLIESIDSKLFELKKEFKSEKIELLFNAQPGGEYIVGADISSILRLENIWMLGFEFTLNGFERGGKNAFDSWFKFEIHFDKYKFILGPTRNDIWEDRAFNEMLSIEELNIIADRFVEWIIDDINKRVELLLAI